MVLACVCASAQDVTALLKDGSNGEPIGFATISLTKSGQDKAYKYILSNEAGEVTFEKVRNGKYVFKAEMMGYLPVSKEFEMAGKDVALGTLEMKPDTRLLDAATVSATGNPVIIKKDTVEFNASSFKTTENDALEDLLKKLPGVEVAEDGSITFNGETIKKITIDGKTFFLDDPTLASKNLPAKMVEKLKVVNKKSEQAEFTGIDDGEEETVIDLSVKKGMMNGTFGNVLAGAGRDIPSTNVDPDWRYQTGGFVGKFTDKTQISFLFNGNNTNNRAFNDIAGGMMGGMMGGGGRMGDGRGGWGNGNGITTSWMGGANIASTLFDDKMNIGGNYLYNYSNKDVEERSDKATYLDDYTLYSSSSGFSNTMSQGHRMGMRLEHKFSENTSILFEPQFNIGGGTYAQESNSSTGMNSMDNLLNKSRSLSSGDNRNWNASGFGLFRQRLGIPGRTMTIMAHYNFSNNELRNGLNWSNTTSYVDGMARDSLINQVFTSSSRSRSLWANATYTEPVGNNFYVEANYSFRVANSTSDKNTDDVLADGSRVFSDRYSNSIVNGSTNHEGGFNVLYQAGKCRAQLGLAAVNTDTRNETTTWNSITQKYEPRAPYHSNVWKFSPRAMVYWEFNDNTSIRTFYRGESNQPSVNRLIPVPDVSDPLNISFGNPTLKPYFAHNLRGDFRFSNKQTFTSFNVRFNAGLTQDPIVNMTWYGANGGSYSMPFNGPTSANAGFNSFFNTQIAKSNFSLSNMLRFNWSNSSNYVGTDVAMDTYNNPNGGYYAFMDELIGNFEDENWYKAHVTENVTNNYSGAERLRITYRNDALELSATARTRINYSTYTISSIEPLLTFNNQLGTTANWTWEQIGLTTKGEFEYNWYNGYASAQAPEFILNAEIQKSVLKKMVTLALKGYDILGQAKNLSVNTNGNNYSETVNNTLGRYIIFSATVRFGTFKGGMGGGRGPGGPGGRGPMGR